MKRRVMAVLLVVIICLAGCSSGNSSSGKSSEKTTTGDSASNSPSKETGAEKKAAANEGGAKINIWLAGSGEAEYDAAFREVFDKFAADNGVTYELTFIPWSDYFTKLNTGLWTDGVGSGFGLRSES